MGPGRGARLAAQRRALAMAQQERGPQGVTEGPIPGDMICLPLLLYYEASRLSSYPNRLASVVNMHII